jgi:hypothetical protein
MTASKIAVQLAVEKSCARDRRINVAADGVRGQLQ